MQRRSMMAGVAAPAPSDRQPRYFREDSTVEKFQPRPLLKRAIRDVSTGGSTFEAFEATFERLLDRDSADKYVLSNDLWTWTFHNHGKLDETVKDCLVRVKEGSEDADGGLTVDLHGMRRWTAASIVVFMICCELDEERDSSLTFITGRGKHSNGPPVLLSNMVHLFRELKCNYEMPNDGSFKVSLSAEFRATWESAFSSSRLSDIQGGSRQPRTVGIPGDVSDQHWNPEKQDGVERVKGRKRDKKKQAQRHRHAFD